MSWSRFKRVLHLDYETFSEADLPKVGVPVYAEHPSTEIIMGAYSFGHVEREQDVRQWDWMGRGELPPEEFIDALMDSSCLKVAWNASFEQVITQEVLGVPIRYDEWLDPMIQCMYLSMPGALDKAGKIVGLPEELAKQEGGKALITKFSKPRKPTKARPDWVRNMPSDHPEDYDRYLLYNRRDVVAECAILKLTKPWLMPWHEWVHWFLDREINDKGVPVSVETARNAFNIYQEYKSECLEEMAEISGLENPNSGKQLLPWLKERGYVYDDLKKVHVVGSIEEEWDRFDEDTLRVLELRREASQTAPTKYNAVVRGTNEDGLMRQTLQFYGAARTGRWGGRRFQPQNLKNPGEFADKADEMAHILKEGDLRSIEMLYGNPMNVLSRSVRAAVQAPPGYVLVDCDLNAIENRVLGWIAEEDAILDVFKQGLDPYVAFAVHLNNRSYEDLWREYKVEKNKTARTEAKPGVLGCLRGDTPVLTHRGWKAIVELSDTDWLHDGEKWVRHQGVVFKGFQKVLCRSGVYATPDHRFLTEKGWREWESVSRQQMFSSALAMGSGVFSHTSALHEAPGKSIFAGVNVVENESYRDQILCADYPRVAPDALRLTVAPTSEKGLGQSFSTYSQIVSTLRDRVARTRRTVNTVITEDGEFLSGSIPRKNGSNTSSMSSGRMGLLRSTEPLTTVTTNAGIFASPPDLSRTQTADTWDILNTGDYARFAVLTEDGCLVSHNCGYMLGKGKQFRNSSTGELEATGLLGYAWNMGIDFTPEQSEKSVRIWRESHPKVQQFWWKIQDAAFATLRTGKPHAVGPIEFDISAPFLRMRLPSGRHLHYYKAHMAKRMKPWGEKDWGMVYYGINDKGHWGLLDTHPGKLTENADQAISRDVLQNGITLCVKEGLDVRLHVHDQNIALVKEEDADYAVELMKECMAEVPIWAAGLPLAAEGMATKVFWKD